MSRWNWTVCLLAGPFVVLPLLLVAPARPPSTPRTAPAALDRTPAPDHDDDTVQKASAAAEADWQTASEAGTPEAYRDYLRRHPGGAHAAEARLRLEQFPVSPEPPTSAAEADGSKPTSAAAAAPPGETAEDGLSLRPDAPAANAGSAAANRADDAEVQSARAAAPLVTSAPPATRPVAHEPPRSTGDIGGRSRRASRSAGPAEPKPGSTPASLSYAPVVGREPARGRRLPAGSGAMRSNPHRFKLSELVEPPSSAVPALKSRAAVRKAHRKVRPHRSEISPGTSPAAGRKHVRGAPRQAPQSKSAIRARQHELRRHLASARQSSGSARMARPGRTRHQRRHAPTPG